MQASIVDWFDKRQAVARKEGNRKILDQARAERDAFEKSAILPATLPVPIRQKLAFAQNAIDSAYDAACRAYTKAGKDDEAARVQSDWDEFRRSVDRRDHWLGERATYKNVQPGIWHEFQGGRPTYQWKEVARTPEFVEVVDEQRQLWARFFPDVLLTSNDGKSFSSNMRGSWKQ